MKNRKITILKAIVDEFIETAEPIGSKTLMTKYNLPYSSATIRNDMQSLEEMGYLEKHMFLVEEYLVQKVISFIVKT